MTANSMMACPRCRPDGRNRFNSTTFRCDIKERGSPIPREQGASVIKFNVVAARQSGTVVGASRVGAATAAAVFGAIFNCLLHLIVHI